MLLTEWDTEEAKKVWYEEGWEEGREEGREENVRYILGLFDQGLSMEDVRRRLEQPPD
jgi:flagellar biosynthesis/type III secretory pathway protein FliH